MLEDDQCPVCGPRCLCSPASVAMCSFDDCVHPAESSGLCAAHRKQRQRTGRLVPVVERLEPRARLREAALALADADSEDDRAYDLAERRFWAAVRAAAREYGAEHIDELLALVSPRGRKIRR